MKIVSNFEDYYDLHQGYDSTPNPSITYLRQTREADVFVKMKFEESLKKQIKTVKRFASSSVTPEWAISFFLIGVGGQINKGVRITCGDEVEHSYTQTGAFYLPTKMGIHLSDEIKTNAYEHFCEFTFRDDMPFRLLNAPVFCVFSDDWNITRVVARSLTTRGKAKGKKGPITWIGNSDYSSEKLVRIDGAYVEVSRIELWDEVNELWVKPASYSRTFECWVVHESVIPMPKRGD